MAGRARGLGRVPGSGRQKGTPNKKTQAQALALVQASAADGVKISDAVLARLDPVSVMLHCMRAALKVGNTSVALQSAQAAAPYVHAKLANVSIETRLQTSLLDFNDQQLHLISTGQMAVPQSILDALADGDASASRTDDEGG
ncbi:hypothetical protein [Lichenicoccus roseus]|uniref:Uncharacterized protein n=1 Tax=Lichenicoccus roseus TaxID=2683649 RepID=A0A5R9J4P2_9PROT|nr:hypothetical protein [Lichenicoccus roseus]TLU70581.1 hypothetical protein FE263_21080 [Lichenicoccus roseus]